MAFKLAISGKGGVGKSTLAGTLARLWAEEGCRVLAIDADPDANLASALGIPSDLRESVHTISDECQLIEERTGAKPKQFGQVFSLNPDVSGIAEQYGTAWQGVNLVVLGAVQRAGGGCACPESVLLKALVRDIVLNSDDVVILDMEAGIEHLGRGTAMGVDMMLAVVEPGQRSVETAHRVQEMAKSLGINGFGVILNKSTSLKSDLAWLATEFDEESVIGAIPYDTRIISADKNGQSIADLNQPDLLAPFCEIKAKLEWI